VRRLAFVVVVLAACGVRAPSPVDVGDLLARRGPVEARRDLEIRILADPKDIQARLALAALDESIGRPSEAIDQLDFVDKLGGPIGTRWHDDDRARFARLLLDRANARRLRGSASAVADYEHAATLGPTDAAQLTEARARAADAELRHVDAEVRARGRAFYASKFDKSPHGRAELGMYAWSIGARREAYEQLVVWHAATPEPRDPKLEAAYLRALAWWSPPESPVPAEADAAARCWFVAASCKPPVAQPPDLVVADPAAPPRVRAALRYTLGRTQGASSKQLLAAALAHDPAVAESRARDFVAESKDAAEAHAIVGALFDALGDPGRARTSWQAAADASPEPLYFWGLAEACARSGDGPAALVHATTAAAAWGDPAVVWVGVARALEERGNHVDALTAAGSAIELGDIETLPPALDVALAASRALGRDAQVKDLEQRRARLPRDADREEALAAVNALPNAVTLARAWVVSRANPRDAELRAAMLAGMADDDPRRPTIVAELVALASDPDPGRALAAARALK
jgi:tetratricopeptide (TPR) repeat protein